MLICDCCGDPILDYVGYEKIEDEGTVCEYCLEEEEIMNEDLDNTDDRS